MNRLIDKIWLFFCSLIAIAPAVVALILAISLNNWTYLFIMCFVFVSGPLGMILLLFRVIGQMNQTIEISKKE